MSTFDPNSPPPSQPNPYAPPPVVANAPPFQPSGVDPRLMKTIREFRSQNLALGVAWIAVGCLILGVSVAAVMAGAQRDPRQMQALWLGMGIVGAVALAWIAVGAVTCMRKNWAVYVGLILSYLTIIGSLLTLNWCPAVLLAVVVVQAHRVIGFANQIQRAGFALDAKV